MSLTSSPSTKPVVAIILNPDGFLLPDRYYPDTSAKIEKAALTKFGKAHVKQLTEMELQTTVSHFYSEKRLKKLHKLISKVGEYCRVHLFVLTDWKKDPNVEQLKQVYGQHSFSQFIFGYLSSKTKTVALINWRERYNDFFKEKYVILDIHQIGIYQKKQICSFNETSKALKILTGINFPAKLTAPVEQLILEECRQDENGENTLHHIARNWDLLTLLKILKDSEEILITQMCVPNKMGQTPVHLLFSDNDNRLINKPFVYYLLRRLEKYPTKYMEMCQPYYQGGKYITPLSELIRVGMNRGTVCFAEFISAFPTENFLAMCFDPRVRPPIHEAACENKSFNRQVMIALLEKYVSDCPERLTEHLFTLPFCQFNELFRFKNKDFNPAEHIVVGLKDLNENHPSSLIIKIIGKHTSPPDDSTNGEIKQVIITLLDTVEVNQKEFWINQMCTSPYFPTKLLQQVLIDRNERLDIGKLSTQSEHMLFEYLPSDYRQSMLKSAENDVIDETVCYWFNSEYICENFQMRLETLSVLNLHEQLLNINFMYTFVENTPKFYFHVAAKQQKYKLFFELNPWILE